MPDERCGKTSRYEARAPERTGIRASVGLPSDGEVVAIAPLGPRPVVAGHARIAEEAQDEVAVRAAVVRLAIRHDGLVRCDPGARVERAQLVEALERAVGPQVLLPLHVDGAGNVPGALRVALRAGVL